MRKPVPSILVFSVLALLVSLVLAETLVVKVQSTSLRKTPKFYGAVIQALQAGDKVEKVASQPDGWIQVKTSGGVVGWVHTSAVNVPKSGLLAMNSGLKTQASASEVALAGKGFNKQIEDNYRAQHKDISFAEVDKMLLLKIAGAELAAFMKQGRLGDWRGVK